MRLKVSRVSFLMCPFCVRRPVSVQTTVCLTSINEVVQTVVMHAALGHGARRGVQRASNEDAHLALGPPRQRTAPSRANAPPIRAC